MYKFRCFQNNEYEEYRIFLEQYGNGEKETDSCEAMRWWAPQNPYKGYVLFAHTEGEVVSRCTITGRRLLYNNKPVECFEIGGTRTSPQHQRRGLFSKLVSNAIEIAFKTSARVVYGTPNDRSGPGYKKLQFKFIDQQDSALVLRLTSLNPLLRKLRIHQKAISEIKNGKEFQLGDIKLSEISFLTYKNATYSFSRMNVVINGYLYRRFSVGKFQSSSHRFFHGQSKNEEFYCSIRNYKLDFMHLLLLNHELFT